MRARGRPWVAVGAMVAACLAAPLAGGHERAASVPMECSRGGGGQHYRAVVTAPEAAASGARFTVRIDATPSGTLAYTGLRYITDMTTDWQVGPGARVVDVRVVPETGSANVRPGARAYHDGEGVHLALPARVENGDGYTPPSVEVELELTAAPGGSASVLFDRQSVTANVLVLGDLRTVCVPRPRPSPIATTRATDPAR